MIPKFPHKGGFFFKVEEELQEEKLIVAKENSL
jgi:hypothetical protein